MANENEELTRAEKDESIDVMGLIQNAEKETDEDNTTENPTEPAEVKEEEAKTPLQLLKEEKEFNSCDRLIISPILFTDVLISRSACCSGV